MKMFKANPKVFDAYIKSKQSVKDTISHLIKEDGSVIENNSDIAANLSQYFKTTFREKTLDNISEFPKRTTSRLSDITITEQSVLSRLLCFNCTMTAGLDKIHLCLIKKLALLNQYTICLTNHCMLVNFLPTGKMQMSHLFIRRAQEVKHPTTDQIKLFADGTKIYSIIRNISDSFLLQKNLDLVNEWPLKWLLKFNPDKCKLLQLGNSNPTSYYLYDPNTHARPFIFRVTEEKDLGL